MAETTTDMTMGVYRRLYSALLHGRRINAVSDSAELLFCRLLLLADDFGNLPGDPQLIKAGGFPRRKWSVRKIEAALSELLGSGDGNREPLLSKYTSGGETYIHISRFEDIQPAGKNGKRIRRYPPQPEQVVRANPRESKRIQCSEIINETTNETTNDSLPPSGGDSGPGRLPVGTFEATYAEYPKHTAKDDAERAYRKKLPVVAKDRGCSLADAAAWMLGRVRTYAASPYVTSRRDTDDWQYVPAFGPWLNKGRYNDADTEWAARARSNGHAPEKTVDELLAIDKARRAKS